MSPDEHNEPEGAAPHACSPPASPPQGGRGAQMCLWLSFRRHTSDTKHTLLVFVYLIDMMLKFFSGCCSGFSLVVVIVVAVIECKQQQGQHKKLSSLKQPLTHSWHFVTIQLAPPPVYPLSFSHSSIHTCNLCHSIYERASSCGRKEAAEGTKHNTQHSMTHKKRQQEGQEQKEAWGRQAAKRQTSNVDRHFVNAIFGFIDWINTYLA